MPKCLFLNQMVAELVCFFGKVLYQALLARGFLEDLMI